MLISKYLLSELPEGTTHISKPYMYINSNGRVSWDCYAFKYIGKVLVCYDTDNDNEYPCWSQAVLKFKAIPELS